MAKVYVEFEEPKCCYDCPLFYATEGAYSDRCQLLNEKAEKINIWKEKLENCPLKKVDCSITELEKENADLKAEIGLNEATIQDQLKDRVKVIKENEDLKKQIDCYKAFESHFDEIEEDAKAIAEENEELKAQIERMKCCENCEYENFEKYHGGKCNLGNYKTCGNWEIRK